MIGNASGISLRPSDVVADARRHENLGMESLSKLMIGYPRLFHCDERLAAGMLACIRIDISAQISLF
jgi:hypothetical protein